MVGAIGRDGVRPAARGLRAGLAATALAGLLSGALAGCTALPQSGPATRAVIDGAEHAHDGKYYLVSVSPAILSVMREHKEKELAPVFADGHAAPVQPIGVGDTVSVTIWEASGLFGVGQAGQHRQQIGGPVTEVGGDNQAVTLPTQVVDQSGDITVPFAGRIPTAGLTPAQVERAIGQALKGKAIAPQVVVTVAQNGSSFATVAGDVNHPGRVPLSLTGTRILDALALAGGGAASTSDTAIQLTRERTTRRVRLDSIVKDPSENIYMRPGDLLYVLKEPQTVVILGATNKNEQVAFGKSGISLAEVVGNGGGLDDRRADPYGVFVFRYEPAALVQSLGPQTSEGDPNALVPVVYQVNLKSPNGYFVAQSFAMRDRDLVFVSNTESVQLLKIAGLANAFATIFKSGSYSNTY